MSDLFNSEIALGYRTNVEHRTEARIRSQYSKSTLARMEATKESLIYAQESMIKDLAQSPLNDPQETMDSFMKIKGIQQDINELTENIAENVSSEFTTEDVVEMQRMKKQNTTEKVIANRFRTNQTKVNRLLNGND